MMDRWLRVALVGTVVVLGSFGRANADLITIAQGSDCAGVFGPSFKSCAIPDTYDPDNAPVIIKFNANGGVSEINSALFPTISGDEFSLLLNSDGSGRWMYTPDANDPTNLVSFYVAKGGNFFNLFGNAAGNGNSWSTPINPKNQKPFGLSHLSLYGSGAAIPNPTEPVPTPEPATLLLVGGGLGAALRLRRRARATHS